MRAVTAALTPRAGTRRALAGTRFDRTLRQVAEAALRTAPATAPATLSLKTDGMM